MRRDWLWLTVIALFGLAPRLYTLAHTTVASRDCIHFIQLAVNLDDPPRGADDRRVTRSTVLQRAEHPPGYPAALIVMAHLAHGTAALDPDAWMRTGQLVSIAAGCWLVVPIYFMGRQAFDRTAGLIAAALATALPTVAEVTADAISDGLFLVAAATALALAQRGLNTIRWYWWPLAGATSAAAYLVRPEGILLIATGSAALIDLGVRFRAERRRAVIGLIGFLLGFAALAGPYIATIGKLTNKPSGGELLGNETAHRPLFAAWLLHSDAPRMVNGAKLALSEPFRAAHYGVGILGLLGAVSLRKNRAAMLLVVHAVLCFLLLGYLGTKMGYVSRRHGLTIAVIASVFAAGYLKWLAGNVGRNERRNLGIFVLILLGASYPFNFKRLHPNREGHRLAGLWVAEHFPADTRFVDPFTWAEFCAGRSFRGFPNSEVGRTFSEDAVYALVEPKNPNPNSIITGLDYAKSLAAVGVVVYQWPPNVPLEKADVAIYKVSLIDP